MGFVSCYTQFISQIYLQTTAHISMGFGVYYVEILHLENIIIV